MDESKNFRRVQRKIIRYLGSQEFKERGDADSTQSSVPILQQIVKLGYLTNNSQEGNINNSYNNKTKTYSREEERAYVSGFMQPDKARNFIEYINTYTDKVAFIIYNEPSDEFYNLFISTTYIPSIALTISGSSKSPNNIPMSINSKTFPVLPSKIIESEKEQLNLHIQDQLEYVECFDPLYGRLATSNRGLYNDVLNALENI